MKLIHGLWLILIVWGIQIASRILAAGWGGRVPYEMSVGMIILSPILYLVLGLCAFFIAYSGKMQARDRVVLLLLGLMLLLAGSLGLFTSLAPWWWTRWPGLESIVLALGVVITAVQMFAATVLGLRGTTNTATRLLILSIPALYAIVVVRDLQAAPSLGMLALLVVTVAVLFGSYRIFPNRGWQA